jgi:hypothetical protein
MKKVFRGNPRLLLQVVPVAAAVIILKWLYDVSPLRHLELSPLLTGVIAAEVFIVGFMLSGTASDFKDDNPYEYYNGTPGAADVDLGVLEACEQRLRRLAAEMSGDRGVEEPSGATLAP